MAMLRQPSKLASFGDAATSSACPLLIVNFFSCCYSSTEKYPARSFFASTIKVRIEMKPKAAQIVLFISAFVVTALASVNSAQAANKFRVLHNFLNKPAANPPSALVADTAGNTHGGT